MKRSRDARNGRAVFLSFVFMAGAPLFAAGPGGTGPTDSRSIIGFSPGSLEQQRAAEAHALTIPTPENARRWLRILTAEPHVAGTPEDHKTALFVRDKLREWGWKADLEEMEVLLNYPFPGIPPQLVISRPTHKTLALDESPIATDKDSANSKAFGAFHGYGISGEASGQVVYANYGRPDDFAALEKMGIDIKNKIVLVRYGEIFRGLKVYNAQKRGAAGILIYSDPADDGYSKGETYPHGRFRPESAIQRGSVQFLSHGPGDPSTPFGPSLKDAKRIPFHSSYGFPLTNEVQFRQRAGTLAEWEKTTGLKRDEYFATIPALPISYGTAREILQILAGPNVPSGWQGGLPLPYHVGPGPAELSMSTTMEYKLRKIWNVIATIHGSEEPDRWVMIGNHRDAWVYGAVDPGSGTAATMETCRALGAAVKSGWKPRRTLVYASWDAEEYGLVGSTEWAEAHADELKTKAVFMLNVDSAISGHEVGFGGVPSLRDFVLEAAGAIADVRTGRTLRDLWTEARRKAWAGQSPLVIDDPAWDGDHQTSTSKQPNSRAFSPQMNWLGSGSDYTVFVDHLGIPAVDAGLRGGYGVYHSIYDNFNWMEHFGDPEFLNHATAARLYTLIAMRAAGAEVVPMRFAPYGLALREHVDELRTLRARKQRQADGRLLTPGAEFEDVSDLIRAVQEFQDQARVLDHAAESVAGRDGRDRSRLASLNDAIAGVERTFLLDEGLPGRPWFKHAIYAPGLSTGYAAWPLPAIRQAIEDNDSGRLAKAVASTSERIRRAAAALRAAADRARSVSEAG
jgi:N-acetylated-alpha-linked acidic dipeptidase